MDINRVVCFFKSIFKDVKLFLKLIIGRKLKKILKRYFNNQLAHSEKRILTKSDNVGESLFEFKEITFEKVCFSKVFNLAEASNVQFFYPKIELKRFYNATIYAASDFIITDKYAVWDKYYFTQFTKLIPHDEDIVKLENGTIYISKPNEIFQIENGFSFCGVHSNIWSHFLVQFLPKLYLLKQTVELVNSKLTIVLPVYNDLQIKEIVQNILAQFNNIEIFELQSNQSVNCKSLFAINNTAYICDHSTYVNPSDIIIPNLCLNILKVNFVSDIFEKYNIANSKHNRKIFIGRSSYRDLINGPEVEEYFVNLGFEVILPHLLTLKEKIETFNQASVIIGPFSSGFTNILFCKPHTKILTFANFHRTFDSYLSTFSEFFELELLMLTGIDNGLSITDDSYIDLENVKIAYSQLIK